MADNSESRGKKRKSPDEYDEDGSYLLNGPSYPAGKGKPVRIYADGVYDMFHYGHARSLKQAKELFPNCFLIVGVTRDDDTFKYKGRTLMDEDERAEMVMHSRYVDLVVARCPWTIDQAFIDKHKIDYVVHGEDFSAGDDGVDAYAFVKSIGKFKTIKRTDGVSTSDLILRILKDYDEYLRRNLRRGYSRSDLGISFLKEWQVKSGDTIKNVGTWVASLFGTKHGASESPSKKQKTETGSDGAKHDNGEADDAEMKD